MNKITFYVPISSGVPYNSLLNEVLSTMPEGCVEREDVGGYVQIYVTDKEARALKNTLIENNFVVYINDPHDDKNFSQILETNAKTAAKWSDVIHEKTEKLIIDMLNLMPDDTKKHPLRHTDDIKDITEKAVNNIIDMIQQRFYGIRLNGEIKKAIETHQRFEWAFTEHEISLLCGILKYSGTDNDIINELINRLAKPDTDIIYAQIINIRGCLETFKDKNSNEPVFSDETRTVYSEIVNDEIDTRLTATGEKALSNLHDFIRRAFYAADMTDNKNTEIRDEIDAELDALAWYH